MTSFFTFAPTDSVHRDFNPAGYSFKWTADWYEWDRDEAHKQALKDRNKAAQEALARGYKVRKFSTPRQMITRGGIGTPHPEITLFVTTYGLTTL